MISDEVKELFQIVRTRLGAPIRPIQLTDDMLCNLLKLAIGDYSQHLQNFIIQSNWMAIYGKQTIITPTDLAYAISKREMNLSQQISYYFSKEVGLQQRGNYELKKDYFTIEKGKQVYIIPSGRELNGVMYCTPSTTKAALYGANYGGFDTGIGGGFSQYGNMGNGYFGFFFGQMYDTSLMAANLKYTNSMLRGDLAYKVTAGPNGTHLVHLMSVPGSPNSFGGRAFDDASYGMGHWSDYAFCNVWYTYYDIDGLSEDDVDECRKQNNSIIISPDTVPMDRLQFEYLNNPAQQTVRQLLIAESMITLAMVRGYASGKVSIPEAELVLDYSMFMDLGKTEKKDALDALDKYLEQLLPQNMLKNQADMMDSTKKILDMTPLGLYLR